MKAAVVTAFDAPPRYLDFPDPVARGKDETVVDVLAAGLHPRVRSQADGSHYTSTGALPLVPGVDAVVRDPKGRIRYAVLDDTTLGTMAERTVIELDRSVVLPDRTDPVLLAAAMNPAMSSWVALRQRIDFGRRQRVLVLGATGNAGRMAIQVAKRFGASQVIAAGREPDRLGELGALGADQTCTFDQLAAAAEVDVVLDYVWGEPTAKAMADLLTARRDRSRPLTWIEIGSVAGPRAPIPSAALRSARLQIIGSGIGSVPGRDFVKEVPKLAEAVAEGTFDVRARAMPLSEVEQAWTAAAETSDRIVLVP
jgi:NADPH:quinone reductase-like Zn-dependent oxidoreductase